MDAEKSDPNAVDLGAEIAKTSKLIQKLLKSAETIDRRRNLMLDASHKIWRETSRKQDRELRLLIDILRDLIHSLEQFPCGQPDNCIYNCLHIIQTTTNSTPSSLGARKQAEEISMRKLKFRFHHNIKNLAEEREMARELRKCEKTCLHQPDHTEEPEMQTNRYYIPLSQRRWIRVKPLPTEDIDTLIKIWVGKIEDASIRLLHDSKCGSTATRQSYDGVRQTRDFGRQFYMQVDVGRVEFKKQWDSMPDVKRNIAKIEFSLIKARQRHERGCTEVERLRKEMVEMDEGAAEMLKELRNIRREISAASFYMLELQTKQTHQL